jgi:hypothetical protein
MWFLSLAILLVVISLQLGEAATPLPTSLPSVQPSSIPSAQPSDKPSGQPSKHPTSRPTGQPSTGPTSQPSTDPTSQPSTDPTSQPSAHPSSQPSSRPTGQPTTQPSVYPTSQPSVYPSGQPTSQPSARPSSQPTVIPSGQPTSQPSGHPSSQPSAQPSSTPTNPTSQPSSSPTSQPSSAPTSAPCRECEEGQYFNYGSVNGTDCRACTGCPPGYKCAGKCSYPEACPPGTYQSQYGENTCTTCPTGTYNLFEGKASCTPCPAGSFCDTPDDAPVSCPRGYYSHANAANCTACPGGTFNTLTGQSSCQTCSAGYECPEASFGKEYMNERCREMPNCVFCTSSSGKSVQWRHLRPAVLKILSTLSSRPLLSVCRLGTDLPVRDRDLRHRQRLPVQHLPCREGMSVAHAGSTTVLRQRHVLVSRPGQLHCLPRREVVHYNRNSSGLSARILLAGGVRDLRQLHGWQLLSLYHPRRCYPVRPRHLLPRQRGFLSLLSFGMGL